MSRERATEERLQAVWKTTLAVNMLKRVLARAGFVLLSACEGGMTPAPMMVENSGHACLHTDPEASGMQSFLADAPVYIVYDSFGTCLSSNCTKDRSAECATTLQGAHVELTSTLLWRDSIREENNICNDDCLIIDARCSTPALAAGTYTFQFGSKSIALEIPSQHADPPCIDSSAATNN